MDKLREGTKLQRIYWPDGTAFVISDGKASDFVTLAESIAVSLEPGQMAYVPWALIKCRDGETHLVNLALCEGVVLKED